MATSKGISIGGATGDRTAPVAVELDKLSLEQLKAVKEQADMEVNLLQDSLNNIRTATARLDLASNSLQDLSLRPQGKKMLVPLTASLYVAGMLDDADKVLVDVGTGYFIEKTMAEGKDYCERKINLLKSNYDQLLEVAAKKKSIADEVTVVLQAKLKQLAPAQLKFMIPGTTIHLEGDCRRLGIITLSLMLAWTSSDDIFW